MDVSKPESPRHIVARALRHGPVVAVVHNVGVHMAVRLSASAGAVAAEHQRRMRKVLAVNLESVVALTMEAVPHLLRSRGESCVAFCCLFCFLLILLAFPWLWMGVAWLMSCDGGCVVVCNTLFFVLLQSPLQCCVCVVTPCTANRPQPWTCCVRGLGL